VTEIAVSSIEDAVIRVATAPEPVRRVLVDTFDSSFLAYNTVHGYSHVDFQRPDNGKLRELAAMLDVYCDWEQSQRLYTGLYLDMLALLEPELELVFTKSDPVPSSRGWTRSLLGERGGRALARTAFAQVVGSGRRPRTSPWRAQASPPPRSGGRREGSVSDGGALKLVAFGDSYTFGTEIDECELGRVDPSYRFERAYPYRLARELGIEYGANLAESGRSNPKILRRVLDFVAEHRDDLHEYFIVVGLTHPGRKGFVLKNGWEYIFINELSKMEPWVLNPLFVELFFPRTIDPRMNEELEHRYWVLHCFLKRLGARFAVFPAWSFADSDEFFRQKNLGPQGIFYLDQAREKFGFRALVDHLPRGKDYHPLSEGHALFAAELGREIRQRGLL
jgi:hypothetical protein